MKSSDPLDVLRALEAKPKLSADLRALVRIVRDQIEQDRGRAEERNGLENAVQTANEFSRQINFLADFLLNEVSGEPSQNQGAVDTAIRVIRELQKKLALSESDCVEEDEYWKNEVDRLGVFLQGQDSDRPDWRTYNTTADLVIGTILELQKKLATADPERIRREEVIRALVREHERELREEKAKTPAMQMERDAANDRVQHMMKRLKAVGDLLGGEVAEFASLPNGTTFRLLDGKLHRIVEEASPETSEKAWYEREMLPEVCLQLRNACNGSADPWSAEKISKVCHYLRDRLKKWEPSSRADAEMLDEAVRMLVIATLAEITQITQTSIDAVKFYGD